MSLSLCRYFRKRVTALPALAQQQLDEELRRVQEYVECVINNVTSDPGDPTTPLSQFHTVVAKAKDFVDIGTPASAYPVFQNTSSGAVLYETLVFGLNPAFDTIGYVSITPPPHWTGGAPTARLLYTVGSTGSVSWSIAANLLNAGDPSGPSVGTFVSVNTAVVGASNLQSAEVSLTVAGTRVAGNAQLLHLWVIRVSTDPSDTADETGLITLEVQFPVSGTEQAW